MTNIVKDAPIFLRALRNHRTRQTMAVLTAILIFCIVLANVDLRFQSVDTPATLNGSQGLTPKADDLSAAIRLCEWQTSRNYGQALRSSELDSHSSRFDKLSGRFFVFFDVRLYDQLRLQRYVISCRVLPQHYTIEYFSAVKLS